MICIECKSVNADDKRYCGDCGAELGRTVDETIRRKGFRDRRASEMEITEAVIGRLVKWAGWLGFIGAFIVGSFGVSLRLLYKDTKDAAQAGRGQIETAIQQGMQDIKAAQGDLSTMRQTATELKGEYAKLESDTTKYRRVSQSIEGMQKELKTVRNIVDLGTRTLKVGTIMGVKKGPAMVGLQEIGCPADAETKGSTVEYCVQGSPPILFQRTPATNLRPVASLSTIGFQDGSSLPKSGCDDSRRGTFYVEKGKAGTADRPFLCVKRGEGTFEWVALSTVP